MLPMGVGNAFPVGDEASGIGDTGMQTGLWDDVVVDEPTPWDDSRDLCKEYGERVAVEEPTAEVKP